MSYEDTNYEENIKRIIDRIKKLELELRKAQVGQNLYIVQLIAVELNEVLQALKDAFKTGKVRGGSCLQRGVRNVLESKTYEKLKDLIDDICTCRYRDVTDKINCIRTTIFGVGFTRLILRNIPTQQIDPSEWYESLKIDALTSLATATIADLIFWSSSRVLSTAENILHSYATNIDIYDIEEFRHLKQLNTEINKMIKDIKNQGECPICYRDFGVFDEDTKEEPIKKLLVPCGHAMCKTCIDELEEKNMLKECPLCKQQISRTVDIKEYNMKMRPKRKTKLSHLSNASRKVSRKSRKVSRKSRKASRKSRKASRKSRKAYRKSRKVSRNPTKAYRKSRKASRRI